MKDTMTLERALEGKNKIQENVRKNLFGIDDAIEKASLGIFTWVPYDREGQDAGGNKILYKDLAPAPVIMTAGHGVGKTGLGRNISFSIGGRFSFIPGQPDLSASKIMGRDIYVAGQFFFAEGDINAHVVLFDEISRTPPKVQAPFFQTMEERQAIVDTFDMNIMKVVNKRIALTRINDNDPDDERLLFWPIATGNPFEHEGTYELPEAMWDRFSIHFSIDYPEREKEKLIDSRSVCGEGKPVIKPVMTLEEAHAIGFFFANNVEIGPDVMEYIQRLTENTRPRSKDKKDNRDFSPRELRKTVDRYTRAGASPRYNYHFKAVVRTLAGFRGRLYVTSDDVRDAFPMVATHRVLLNHVARGRGVKQKDIVSDILRLTPVPPSGSRSMVTVPGSRWNKITRILKFNRAA